LVNICATLRSQQMFGYKRAAAAIIALDVP
jgi:hypothetical protein